MNKRIDNILYAKKIEMYDANGTESRSNEINNGILWGKRKIKRINRRPNSEYGTVDTVLVALVAMRVNYVNAIIRIWHVQNELAMKKLHWNDAKACTTTIIITHHSTPPNDSSIRHVVGNSSPTVPYIECAQTNYRWPIFQRTRSKSKCHGCCEIRNIHASRSSMHSKMVCWGAHVIDKSSKSPIETNVLRKGERIP